MDTVTLFSKKKLESLLTPSLLGSHVWLCPRIIVLKSHENTSKYVDTVTFFKNMNRRSLTPRWPLTPRLLSHVWFYLRIIASKSYGNTPMYVDTVINFAKYHILRTTYRMSDHMVSFWTQFRWDKSWFSTNEMWCAVDNQNHVSPMCKRIFSFKL